MPSVLRSGNPRLSPKQGCLLTQKPALSGRLLHFYCRKAIRCNVSQRPNAEVGVEVGFAAPLPAYRDSDWLRLHQMPLEVATWRSMAGIWNRVQPPLSRQSNRQTQPSKWFQSYGISSARPAEARSSFQPSITHYIAVPDKALRLLNYFSCASRVFAHALSGSSLRASMYCARAAALLPPSSSRRPIQA